MPSSPWYRKVFINLRNMKKFTYKMNEFDINLRIRSIKVSTGK